MSGGYKHGAASTVASMGLPMSLGRGIYISGRGRIYVSLRITLGLAYCIKSVWTECFWKEEKVF